MIEARRRTKTTVFLRLLLARDVGRLDGWHV
jgi:hypothetical protein